MTYPLTSTKHVNMQLTSPFGKEAILVSLEGTEEISDLFHFRMVLCSPKDSLSFEKIVGKSITAILKHDKETRYINGIVARFQQLDTMFNTQKKFARTFYEAHVVPSLWNLTLTENCEIFQNKTTIAIIKDILKKHNIHVTDKVQSAGKEELEFCVQYNESDFDFISRLMEANGIFYFFKHEKGKHLFHIADTNTAFAACAHSEKVPFVGSFPSEARRFGVEKCYLQQEVVPKEYSTKDYNFEKPTTNMFAHTKGKGHGGVLYHYPGHYWTKTQSAGEKITKVHLESLEVPGTAISGESNVPFFEAGTNFKMEKHPRASLNQKPLIFKSVTHHAELPDGHQDIENFENISSDATYHNSFKTFPKETVFRPPIKTPTPVMPIQTATVTGKENEEIWTDKYGRIKVKFHWDQGKTKHDKTSCWIRVAQGWTGKKWGFLFIPRVGQEVVIQFINGSPDHPLVTGCVYNQENLPPYLPGEPTKSTIKTNSSKKAKGFNELRFEDKKDKEEIYMHAQKDMLTEVKHNKTTTIEKGDRAFTIKKGNETKTLKEGDSTRTLEKGNETKTLKKGNLSTTLEEGNETRTLKKGDQTIELKNGKRSITVEGGDESHTNKKNFNHKVSSNYSLKVDGNLSIEVTGSITLKSKTDSITIDGMNGVTVKSTSQVKVNGTAGVNIDSSASVSISGTASVSVSSSASLSLSGSASASLSGSGMCSISGGIVSIN